MSRVLPTYNVLKLAHPQYKAEIKAPPKSKLSRVNDRETVFFFSLIKTANPIEGFTLANIGTFVYDATQAETIGNRSKKKT